MLRIFYGRESVDKDRFIYDHLNGETAILVPDQYTLEAEKDILERTGRKGLLDVEILGFSRLADRVLSECGKSPQTPINKYGRYMLLVKILQDVNGRLGVYQNLYRRSSFVEMTNDFLAQIRQNNVDAEELRAILDGISEDSLLKRKLSDICLIYDEYEKYIEGKYIDTEDSISFMADKMGDSSYISSREFWISGFDSFTPKNLQVIGRLMEYGRCVNVVLSYDAGSRDDHIFSLTGKLMTDLKEMAEEKGMDCAISKIEGYDVHRPEGLKNLERELFALPVHPCDNHDGITIVGAAGIYQELETAASFIHGLVRDEGYRFSDIAVICNSLDKNEAGIGMVFGRAGIPAFIDSKRKVASNPLAIYFSTYIRLAIDGIRSSDMLRLIKTGYCSINQDVCDELENYVIENRVRKGGWEKLFTKEKKNHEDMLPLIEEARKNLMDEIGNLKEKLYGCETIHDAAGTLLDHMIHEAAVVEKINDKVEAQIAAGFVSEAEITVQTWNILQDILEQIDEILGDEKELLSRLPDLIDSGIEEAEAGIIPPVCDGISIGTAQRSRIASAKAIVVIGADEGVLPQAAGTENLLNDDELGLLEDEADVIIARTDSVRRAEETLGIYRTFSRASERLWLGTALADEKGDKVKPSPVINTMLRIFRNLEIESDMFADECDDRLFGGKTRTADNMTAALRDSLEGKSLDERWKETIGWFRENDPATLERIEKGLFYSPKKGKIDRELARNLYLKDGEDISVSPSQLEKYARCPFSHFMNYGIRPEERRIVEMAPREIGDIYHEIFMRFAERLTKEGVGITDADSPWMTIEEDEYDKLIDDIADEIVAEYKEGFLLDNSEEAFRTKRLKSLAREIGWILVEHVRAGEIREAKFEASFGRSSEIPPIVFESEGESIYVEGKIDRLDILGNGRVKVIDYKTGTADFSREEAVSGWKLQLMIYLKAGMQYGEERKPAGVFYFHVAEPMNDMTDKEREKISEIIKGEIYRSFKLDGAIIDDEEVIRSIDGDFSDRSAIVPVRVNKDGFYVQTTKAQRMFTDEEFAVFQNDVDDTIQKICDGIVSGDIDIRPKHQIKGKGACDYCSFREMCGFDVAFKECRFEWI